MPDARDPRVLAVAVMLAMVIAAFADAEATGWAPADLWWRCVGAAAVVVSAAFAPPVAVLIAAGIVGASSSSVVPIVFGVLAAVLVVLGVAVKSLVRHEPMLRMAAGVSVSIAAFSLPHDQFHGAATAVAFLATLPLVAGAWSVGPIWYRRVLNTAVSTVAVLFALGVVGVAFAAWNARSDLSEAADLLELAETEFRSGDDAGARLHVGEASASISSASDALSAPWVRATRALPVLGQHTHAARSVLAAGEQAITSADTLLGELDRTALTVSGGAIDIAQIRRLAPLVDDFAGDAASALETVEEADDPWLLPPVSTAIVDLREELAPVVENARRAADAAEVAPAMLGADGPRTYLVLFVTPAESRGSVGLIGNFAVVNVRDGRLGLGLVGRTEDLSEVLEARGAELTGPAGYVERYGVFDIPTQFQDATLSPNFPDVAAAVAELYPQAVGTELDGVVMADPYAVAAMSELAGPVDVQGRTFTPEDMAPFLLEGQYRDLRDDEERVRFLQDLFEATFEQLFTVDFGDPWDFDEVFGPAIDEGRLAVWTFVPAEQELLSDLGMDAAYPGSDSTGGDVVGLITQNAGQNKIDVYLQRSLTHEVELDPETGTYVATITVELTNDAPPFGPPPAVIGNNDQGFPFGTNVVRLTLYSAGDFVGATRDGIELPLELIDEFGLSTATSEVELASGAASRLVFRVQGTIDLTDGYRLTVPGQATVRPDRFEVRVSVPDGWQIDGDPRFTARETTSVPLTYELDVASD